MLIAGLGGFAGTCLRFLTGRLAHLFLHSAFPWGTFAVNVVGSLLIGLLLGLAEKHDLLPPSMQLLFITGFCGGFTTFSTFSADLLVLLQQKQTGLFLLYAAGSLLLGLLMVWLGRTLVKGA